MKQEVIRGVCFAASVLEADRGSRTTLHLIPIGQGSEMPTSRPLRRKVDGSQWGVETSMERKPMYVVIDGKQLPPADLSMSLPLVVDVRVDLMSVENVNIQAAARTWADVPAYKADMVDWNVIPLPVSENRTLQPSPNFGAVPVAAGEVPTNPAASSSASGDAASGGAPSNPTTSDEGVGAGRKGAKR